MHYKWKGYQSLANECVWRNSVKCRALPRTQTATLHRQLGVVRVINISIGISIHQYTHLSYSILLQLERVLGVSPACRWRKNNGWEQRICDICANGRGKYAGRWLRSLIRKCKVTSSSGSRLEIINRVVREVSKLIWRMVAAGLLASCD